MHKDGDLALFGMRLALVGSPPEALRRDVPALQEELSFREHLLNPRVLWDADEARVIVDVMELGRDLQQTADSVAEELFEVAAATLGDFDHFRVEIVHHGVALSDGVAHSAKSSESE